ncbi:Por secretion system C-terminal sorting domain-containing protein [Chitinophaga arvensicola]|uniref:Por secretion system C-terminal sorting domain-containing protein n=2 Tax=Chitinophaga arvensicola TaxID=29529 RepID=A0A1I0SAU7_9BACT|nr:Por secretion system C-terminal sorting domain-containing protein [Chitinophaga arvensicola]
MRLPSWKIWPVLLFQLCYCYYTAAQPAVKTDSLLQRYATDTFSLQRTGGPFFVKFSKRPKESQLQQWRILQPLSRYHYILQQHPDDSTVTYCYTANDNFKASMALLQQLEKIRDCDSITVQLACMLTDNTLQNAHIISYSPRYKVAVASIRKKDWKTVISNPVIQFADLIRRPSPEIIINTANLTLNRITYAQQQFPGVTGKRISVSVKEDLFDTTDIDLQGRYRPSVYASALNSTHALIMATLIGGAGNSGINGKGVAPEVQLSSADYNNSLFPDDDAYYQQSGITVQNHSYGTTIENYYGAEAAAYDQQVYTSDTMVHVYSSGNIGTLASSAGRYSGISGYANLSGNFKQAKNIITAGGTDGSSLVMALSSRGPAYDGRLKPELTAFGEDGTSGAAALTSGVVALLQDAWRQQHNSPMAAALGRALLINSATRAAGTGPSFSHGYGDLHAYGALQTLTQQHLLQGAVSKGTIKRFDITVPEGIQELKVTLCWNDPPAAVNAPKALINDLDLAAITADGKTWLPWILNPDPDSLALPAKRGRDSINNIEQISVMHPVAGNLQLQVSGAAVSTTTQPFYLVYEWIPVKSFQWQNPAPGSVSRAAQTIPLQWQTTYSGNSDISYSTDSGRSWQPVAQNIPLSNGPVNWTTPDIFQPVLLKLTLPDTSFISAPFYISPQPTIHTGFNCKDTVLLYWNAQPGAAAYQLYTLDKTSLIPYSQVRDTFIFLPASQVSSAYFAVSPVATTGWAGLRSYAMNYTQQGVGCYVQTLLADPTTTNQVLLSLTLGSTWHLQTLYWERLTPEGWITLQEQPINNALHLNYVDPQPPEGWLHYRVKLLTSTGTYVYADPVTITLIADNHILLFPNPVSTQLTILDGAARSRKLLITDMSGRIVLQRNLEGTQETVPVQQLANGVYHCGIYADNKRIYSAKFVKQE